MLKICSQCLICVHLPKHFSAITHIYLIMYLPCDIRIWLVSTVLFPLIANHYHIVKEIRETKIKQYRYYDPVTKGLDFEGMIDDIRVSN